ncbi:MAG: adenylate/guanylate cyclase domain-containing protein [Rhodoferax sp.]|nr:adenylate/guanylate cyclase domain-containing protein [Rhodoferax sp.]
MSQRRQITTSGSEDRLESLIRERMQSGADKARIDARIWDIFGEDWCVMFTDLAGFSRHVAEFGIIHFLQTVYESERLLIPVIEDHDGILLKVEGDSMLVIFRNAAKALQCAVTMQKVTEVYNSVRNKEDQVLLCIGLGYGRVLRIGDVDVYGAEVNAASKLGEDRAEAGDILTTGGFREQCGDAPGLRFESLDEVPAGCTAAYRVVCSPRKSV